MGAISRYVPYLRTSPLKEAELREHSLFIPELYFYSTWEEVGNSANLKKLLFNSWYKEDYPVGWFIVGGSSCGKSSLLALVAKFISKNFLLNQQFITFTTLFSSFYEREEKDGKVSANPYQNCDVLFLDDYGTQYATSYANTKFIDLVEYRYSHLLPTYITSTQNVDSIANVSPAFGKRIKDKSWITTLRKTNDTI